MELSIFINVEAMVLKFPTSAVRRRHDTLPDVSAVCKIPAKGADSALALFPVFQEIDSGCCAVAAHEVRAAEPESAPVTFVGLQAKGHRLTRESRKGKMAPLQWFVLAKGQEGYYSNLQKN